MKVPQYKQQLYTFCDSNKTDGEEHGQTHLQSTTSIYHTD